MAKDWSVTVLEQLGQLHIIELTKDHVTISNISPEYPDDVEKLSLTLWFDPNRKEDVKLREIMRSIVKLNKFNNITVDMKLKTTVGVARFADKNLNKKRPEKTPGP